MQKFSFFNMRQSYPCLCAFDECDPVVVKSVAQSTFGLSVVDASVQSRPSVKPCPRVYQAPSTLVVSSPVVSQQGPVVRYSGRLLYVHRPHGTLKRLQMRKTKDVDWKGNGGNPECSLTVNAMCISVMLSTT